MATLQDQIKALFAECDSDLRAVISGVMEFEQTNIHLKEPRYKQSILDVLDRVTRDTLKDDTHEARQDHD